MDFAFAFAGGTWALLLEAGPVLLIGFLLAGAVQAFLPSAKLIAWIGGRGAGAVFRASAAGVPLPLCSCGVMPVAAALRKGGAGRGATVSFLISTPETGVDSIAASAAMLDPLMTVFRPLAAFASALAAGFAENLFGPGEDAGVPKPAEAEAEAETKPSSCCGGAKEGPSGCCGSSGAAEPSPDKGGPPSSRVGAKEGPSGCCGSSGAAEPSPAREGRARQVLRIAFVDLFDDLGLALLVGFGLAGAVSALAPGMSLGAMANSGSAWGSLGEMLLMIAAGAPIYICATAATPLAAALIAGGASPGGALAFLLAGPATNAATLALVAKLLGKRSAAIYLSSVLLCALAMGLSLNALYPLLRLEPRALLAGAGEECGPFCGFFLAEAGAAATLFLSAAGAWRRHGAPRLRALRSAN